jgi:hypothetical protein
MSLFRPTPGIPIWPLEMNMKETAIRASNPTGRPMPSDGPRIASLRTIRKTAEAITRIAPITAKAVSWPGSRIAIEPTTSRSANPTAPSRKLARLRPSASSSARPIRSEASRIIPAERYVPRKAPKGADRLTEPVALRLSPLATQREELVERIAPAEAPQDTPVRGPPDRFDEAPSVAEALAVAGDPAVGVQLRAQERGAPEEAVAPHHQLREREQREITSLVGSRT